MSRIETHNGYCFVEVLEESIRHNVKDGLLYWTTPLHDKTKQVENDKWEMLPIESEWQIIGLASSLTDKDWEGVVGTIYPDSFCTGFVNYTGKTNSVDTPTASGLSLLESMNLKPGQTIVLKKVK